LKVISQMQRLILPEADQEKASRQLE